MFEERDLFMSQGKDLQQNLPKKNGLSVNGGGIRKIKTKNINVLKRIGLKRISMIEFRNGFP